MKRKNLHLISILTIILFLTVLKYSYSQWEFAGTVTNIGDFPEISVADQNTVWIVGGSSGTPVVWRTTNGGTNWTSISTTGLLFDLSSVWGVDANTAFVGNGGSPGGTGGNARFYKTTNAGTTWTELGATGGTAGYFNGIAFSKTVPTVGIAQSDAPNGLGEPYWVSKTTDGGITWTVTNPPGYPGTGAMQHSIVVIDDQFYGWGSFLAPPAFIVTTDGGTTWNKRTSSVTGDLTVGLAFKDDKLTGILGTVFSLPNISRTTDAGVTWATINTGTGVTGGEFACNLKWVNGTNTCYLIGGGEAVFPAVARKSTDGGLTWTQMTIPALFSSVRGMEYKRSGVNVYAYAIAISGAVLKLTEDIPLPVELNSFSSTVSERNVTLNWVTNGEENNSGFEIERLISEKQWLKIGFVNGNGTTTSQKSYSFTERRLGSGSYSYRLKQIDFNGNFRYYNLSNEAVIGVPTKFELVQNYPNPFNPVTKIDYSIPSNGKVSLIIFDALGKQVITLVNNALVAGYYSVDFNASELASGVYYYKLDVSGQNKFSDTKKMLLVK